MSPNPSAGLSAKAGVSPAVRLQIICGCYLLSMWLLLLNRPKVQQTQLGKKGAGPLGLLGIRVSCCQLMEGRAVGGKMGAEVSTFEELQAGGRNRHDDHPDQQALSCREPRITSGCLAFQPSNDLARCQL